MSGWAALCNIDCTSQRVLPVNRRSKPPGLSASRCSSSELALVPLRRSTTGDRRDGQAHVPAAVQIVLDNEVDHTCTCLVAQHQNIALRECLASPRVQIAHARTSGIQRILVLSSWKLIHARKEFFCVKQQTSSSGGGLTALLASKLSCLESRVPETTQRN